MVARSFIAVMALAIISRVTETEASIYQKIAGDGICLPENGESYSYVKTYGLDRPYDCSDACDRVHANHDARMHYRGFSTVVRPQLEIDLHRHDCLCFYDYHHLPVSSENGLVELEGVVWAIGEPVDDHGEESHGEGRIAGGDGTPGIHCYALLVEGAVEPEHEVSSIIWAGYHNVRGNAAN